MVSSDEIIKEVKQTIGSEDLDMKTKSNRLIMLQAWAALDSAETDWAVAQMIEPFTMELDEKSL